jgi:hypothetical protein
MKITLSDGSEIEEFLFEMIEDLISASTDLGRNFSDGNMKRMNSAAEKVYNVLKNLKLKEDVVVKG